MTSEKVLLKVSHVNNNKKAGTLYLLRDSISWLPDVPDCVPINHNYVAVKVQKFFFNQLQIVLKNGGVATFLFNNPMGTAFQLQDLNSVKDLLQQVLTRFPKINKEDTEKNIFTNELLFQLYKDLVTTQGMPAGEFWANYVKKPSQKTVTQQIGVSGSFLNRIRQTDGTYNISPEIMDLVFRTYPAVKKKHMENVPHRMSERDFWTKFIQSHYFSRDRLYMNPNEFFHECEKTDEQDIKRAIDSGIPNVLVDLSMFEEDNLVHNDSQVVNIYRTQQDVINQFLMKRINHYSMMVLRAAVVPESSSNTNIDAVLDSPPDPNKPATSKKKLLEQKLEYDDLSKVTPQKTKILNLNNTSRYLSGPMPITDSEEIVSEKVAMAVSNFNNSIQSWTPNLPVVLDASSANVALGELMPDGTLMKNMDSTHLKDSVPIEIQVEMKELYCDLIELLIHFWHCFPIISQKSEKKVPSVFTCLKNFRDDKLEPFQEKLKKNGLPLHLCDHMRSMFQAAQEKFEKWQKKDDLF